MLLVQLHHMLNTSELLVGDKSEAPRLSGTLVFENRAILNVSELRKVGAELLITKVMRQPSNKDFPILWIKCWYGAHRSLGLKNYRYQVPT